MKPINQRYDVEFMLEGEKIEFSIYHNLPEMRGFDIDSAFKCWLDITDNFTPESFCAYIMSKNDVIPGANFKAMTEGEYRKYQKETIAPAMKETQLSTIVSFLTFKKNKDIIN